MIVFLDVFHRQEDRCPEENASSDEAGARRRRELRRIAQLRRGNAGRRRIHDGRPNYGEAAVVGGDCLFGGFPPAGRPLPGGKCQLRLGGPSPKKRIAPDSSTPMSECWPEEDALVGD